MAQDELIARRYARGLAELASGEEALDRVRSHMALVSGLLDPRAHDGKTPELLDFFESPVVSLVDKVAAAKSIMEKVGVGEEVAGLVCLLLRRGRISLLPKIAREYAAIAGEIAGEYTALVQTAMPLSAEQEKRLIDALSAAFNCSVKLHQEIQPGLLAGAKVTIGDKTFDGSVQGRLDALRHRLTASGWEALELAAKPAAK